jgi:hypothetical protein
MSSYYGPWIWSPEHGSHYAYLYAADGRILDTLWEGPLANSRTTESTTVTQVATPVERYISYNLIFRAEDVS